MAFPAYYDLVMFTQHLLVEESLFNLKCLMSPPYKSGLVPKTTPPENEPLQVPKS